MHTYMHAYVTYIHTYNECHDPIQGQDQGMSEYVCQGMSKYRYVK